MTPLSCNCLSRPAPLLVILCSEPTRRSPGIVSCSGSHQPVQMLKHHRPPTPSRFPNHSLLPISSLSWSELTTSSATVRFSSSPRCAHSGGALTSLPRHQPYSLLDYTNTLEAQNALKHFVTHIPIHKF